MHQTAPCTPSHRGALSNKPERSPKAIGLEVFTASLRGAMLPVKALTSQAMEIQFTTRIFKEGRSFVAHALELDVSSCGGSKAKALKNLKEAVRLFLEEARKMGTLEQILQEARYTRTRQRIANPTVLC